MANKKEIEVEKAILKLIDKYGLKVDSFKDRLDSSGFGESYYTLTLAYPKKYFVINFSVHRLGVMLNVQYGAEDKYFKPIVFNKYHDKLLKQVGKTIEAYNERMRNLMCNKDEIFIDKFLEAVSKEINCEGYNDWFID